MDQKNTIVKCTANPNCLFNHNGTCDNYVITIGADGSCQEHVETSSDEFQITETKRCHDDCIHFDDSDPFVGPICLFNHPEPLKEFYDRMPCDYYHKRGQQAITSIARGDIEIDDELRERFKNFINKWINEHPPLSKEDREIMNDIGYVPPKYPNYEECWVCQYGGSSNMYCSLSVIPMRGPDGKCCRFSRRVEE